MHEKVILFFIIASATIIGCRTNPTTSGFNAIDSLDEYQRRVVELAKSNRELTDRLKQYDRVTETTVERLEDIRERASGIKDTTERIIYLFDAYEREVSEIILTLTALSGNITSVDSVETSEDSAGNYISATE